MFFKGELEEAIGKLKELETSSLENSKIGLKVVRDSMSKLESLKDDIDNQISDLENNFSQN